LAARVVAGMLPEKSVFKDLDIKKTVEKMAYPDLLFGYNPAFAA
jgi:hypothetical protein